MILLKAFKTSLTGIIILLHFKIFSQQINSFSPPPDLSAVNTRTERIKKNLSDNSLSGHVEFPMQDYYHPPFLKKYFFSALQNDTTPPTDPSVLLVNKSSIFSVSINFSLSDDPESGISNYVFGVGTAPGSADIRWWQDLGLSTYTIPLSLKNLGVAEGSDFFITVYAINGAGLESNHISTDTIRMSWETLGDTANSITVEYADWGYDSTGINIISGWDSLQILKYNYFFSRMIPVINEIYGSPAMPSTVTLVRNLYYSGSNIYFPGTNQIHKDDNLNPQLITHELIHAFRDNVILSMDTNWNYDPELSGFEEAFAQAGSYLCMNRYIEVYPDDSLVNSTMLFGSSMDWDYDFRNVSNITTEDLWSDYGGMGLFWERYELAAAAMRKIHLEDSLIIKKFNYAYYSFLNNNHDSTPGRNLIVSLFDSLLPAVEGTPVINWINKQRIFDCKYQPGRKVWVWTQHYPWMEYIIFQRIYYYETFFNGSDWAYYDSDSSVWIYYDLNGSVGTAVTNDYQGTQTWQKNLAIFQVNGGFGFAPVNFSTDNDVDPWPGGDTTNFLLGMISPELYSLQINFDTASALLYRVMGGVLKNTTGIYGGIINAKGGEIFIDHIGYPGEPPFLVTNGFFHGTRSWASVPNLLTGGYDTKPGIIKIIYVDTLGNKYESFRNIDYGSSAGNQVFLFDVNEMSLLVNAPEGPGIHDGFILPNPGTGQFQIKEGRFGHPEIKIYRHRHLDITFN